MTVAGFRWGGHNRDRAARGYREVVETWLRGGDWANQWLSLRRLGSDEMVEAHRRGRRMRDEAVVALALAAIDGPLDQ